MSKNLSCSRRWHVFRDHSRDVYAGSDPGPAGGDMWFRRQRWQPWAGLIQNKSVLQFSTLKYQFPVFIPTASLCLLTLLMFVSISSILPQYYRIFKLEMINSHHCNLRCFCWIKHTIICFAFHQIPPGFIKYYIKLKTPNWDKTTFWEKCLLCF